LWPSLKKATSAAVILDLSGSFNVSYSNMDIANVLYIHGPVLELDWWFMLSAKVLWICNIFFVWQRAFQVTVRVCYFVLTVLLLTTFLPWIPLSFTGWNYWTVFWYYIF
jgi:hypothetical protein